MGRVGLEVVEVGVIMIERLVCFGLVTLGSL